VQQGDLQPGQVVDVGGLPTPAGFRTSSQGAQPTARDVGHHLGEAPWCPPRAGAVGDEGDRGIRVRRVARQVLRDQAGAVRLEFAGHQPGSGLDRQPSQQRGLPAGAGAEIQPGAAGRSHAAEGERDQLRALVLNPGAALGDRWDATRRTGGVGPERRVASGFAAQFGDGGQARTHHQMIDRRPVVGLQRGAQFGLPRLAERIGPGVHDPARVLGGERERVTQIGVGGEPVHPAGQAVAGDLAQHGVDEAGDPRAHLGLRQGDGGIHGGVLRHAHGQ